MFSSPPRTSPPRSKRSRLICLATTSLATLSLATLSLAAPELTAPARAASAPADQGTEVATRAEVAADPSSTSTLAATLPGTTPATQRRIDLWATSGSLTGVQTSPGLSPAFDPAVRDYVVRCPQTTGNTIGLTTTGVTFGVPTGSVRMNAGDAVVLHTGTEEFPHTGTEEYWIRCLPPDFPTMVVHRPGTPPTGYYLTETIFANGNTTYTYILDNRGTPVWWRGFGAPLYTTTLADGTLNWFEWTQLGVSAPLFTFDVATRTVSDLRVDGRLVDGHELQRTADGHRMWLTANRKAADLSAVPAAQGVTSLWDCGIEVIDDAGTPVWTWTMSDHVDPVEATSAPVIGEVIDGSYDPFHCNSIEEQPGTGDFLVSARSINAIFLVDRDTGRVLWKLGGTTPTDPSTVHVIADVPFSGQHDARFQPNGEIALFSNNTGTTEPARAQQFRVDLNARTATTTWSYDHPQGLTALATGSFRRYAGGADNLVSWGMTPGGNGFDEVDAAGRTLLSVRYPNDEITYRTQKVPLSTFDPLALRSAAAGGLPVSPGLTTGDRILSPNGQYHLEVQADGNVALTGPAGTVWSATANAPGAWLTLQPDGNLVLGADGKPAWTSGTTTATSMAVTDDGRFVLLNAQGAEVWSSTSGGSYLAAPGPLTLWPGDRVLSPTWGGHLVMQRDGNLVGYRADGTPTWYTGTNVAGSRAVLQSDGNLVLADPVGRPLWTSATTTGATLAVSDQGVPSLRDASGTTIWNGAAGYHLGGVTAWGTLRPDGRIMSPNWRYLIAMQTDGNLVLYGPSGPLWWSGTNQPGSFLSIQGDGNLVVYSPAGKPLWSSGTRAAGTYLAVQDDGNVVHYSPTGPLWWTGTPGR